MIEKSYSNALSRGDLGPPPFNIGFELDSQEGKHLTRTDIVSQNLRARYASSVEILYISIELVSDVVHCVTTR